jgi:uncharacterized FlaG/YvyC family protein
MKKENNNKYIEMLEKIDALEEAVCDIQQTLLSLKEKLLVSYDEEMGEEVCQDEVDAAKAIYDVIGEICVESLLDMDFKGDA